MSKRKHRQRGVYVHTERNRQKPTGSACTALVTLYRRTTRAPGAAREINCRVVIGAQRAVRGVATNGSADVRRRRRCTAREHSRRTSVPWPPRACRGPREHHPDGPRALYTMSGFAAGPTGRN
ncbi:unnamed protein product [Lampetra planeri]